MAIANWIRNLMHGVASGRRSATYYIGYIALFTIICIILQLYLGAYKNDHGQTSDEASYFVTSLMIDEYCQHHLFSNPMHFATAYYAHFPKVGFGHYAPLLMTVQTALFLIFGASGTTAVAFQAVIGGLCAGVPAAIVSRLGIVLGLAAGIAVLFAPYVLFLVSTIMADNFLAVLVTLSALAWSIFYRKRTTSSALAFSFISALSILTKGTGFGLALMPIIYLSIKRDFYFLLNRKVIFIVVIVGLLTVPWYVATYRLAAAGFAYSWGSTYTLVAIPFFLKSLSRNLGILTVVCYIAGLYLAIKSDVDKKLFDVDVFVATSLAMLMIPMMVPADLDARYIIPAIPSSVIVAAWGLQRLIYFLPSSYLKRPLISSSLCGAVLLLSNASVFHKAHLESFHSERIVSYILDAHRANSLVLVSGSVRLEGAVIAEFAENDRLWSHYVARGTALLANGDFMGINYAERFQTPDAMAQWIKDNQIGWIVLEESKAADEFHHNRTLRDALNTDILDVRLVLSVPEGNGGGKWLLYTTSAVDTKPNRSDEIFSELKPSHRI